MLDTVQQRNGHLAAIEKARDSSVVAYSLHDSAMVADDAMPQLYDKLQAWGHRPRIDLLLYARGGISEAVWRVLNLLRQNCDHLGLIVGTRVHGAASLLALGADEIVMGPLSELGGIETPLKHMLLPHDELGQTLPVTWSEIKNLLSNVGANQVQATSSDLTVYNFIHPLAIAHLQQSDLLNRDLTRKALAMSMPDAEEGQTSRIVDLFNGGFHSPLYTASRAELEGIGLPVVNADEALWRHIWEVAQLYQATIYNDRPDPTNPGALYRYVCVIETIGRSTGLRQQFTQSEGTERILQIGWETAVKGPGPGPNIGPGGMSNN